MWRKGKKEGCSSCSVAELGLRLGIGFRGEVGMVKVFSLHVSLVYSADVFPENTWCYSRLGERGELEESMAGGEDFCDLLGMGSESKWELMHFPFQRWW